MCLRRHAGLVRCPKRFTPSEVGGHRLTLSSHLWSSPIEKEKAEFRLLNFFMFRATRIRLLRWNYVLRHSLRICSGFNTGSVGEPEDVTESAKHVPTPLSVSLDRVAVPIGRP